MNYDVTSLLANVRRLASIPSTATTGSQDSDLLAFANKVLQLQLPSKVISAREGFYRKEYDYSVSTTNRYQIPARAVGNRLAAVLLVDGNGNVTQKLNEIPYSRLTDYYNVNDVAGYLLEEDSIRFFPTSPSSNVSTVRLVFYLCPNALTTSVDAVNASAIAVSSVSGAQLTLAYNHNWTTSTKLDIVRGGPPFARMQFSITPASVGSNTVTFTTAQATGVVAGDYVSLAEYSKFPNLPDALFPLLEHLTAMEFTKAIGDLQNHKRLAEELPKLEADALTLISPRVEEGPKKIVSNRNVAGVVTWANRRYRGV